MTCPTCNRSNYTPWQHFADSGKLLEACCDRSHEPFLHNLGPTYAAWFRHFWDESAHELGRRGLDDA